MNNQQTTEIPQSFLTAIAQSLGDVVSEFTGSEWKLTPAGSPDKGSPADPVCYKVDFTGAVEGGLTLQLARELAASLAAQILGEAAETALQDFDESKSEAVLEVIGAALKKCAAMLSPERGESKTKASFSDKSNDSPAAARVFEVSESGSAKPAIIVEFTSALLDSMAKMPEAPAGKGLDPMQIETKPSAPVENSAAPAPAARLFDEGQLGLVMDVELNVILRFGQRQLSLREIMELTSGSVVELDRQVDEPVELLLDGKVIARGEAVIVDGNYGLKVTDIPQPIKPVVVN